jgi:GNAT superfamily N-acetyltransferase
MNVKQFIVRPLKEHPDAIQEVVEELKYQFLRQEGLELTDRNALVDYVNEFMYVMMDTNRNMELIGFFSFSRIDNVTCDGWLLQSLSFLMSAVSGRMFVYDVCILKQYRNKGYGRIMMQLIEHYCLENFPLVRSLQLHTHEPTLTSFYNKCGYSILREHSSRINVFFKKII